MKNLWNLAWLLLTFTLSVVAVGSVLGAIGAVAYRVAQALL